MTPDESAPAPKRAGVFTALRHRNYRLFWFGNLVSMTGDWLDQVALNWLVISTTGDPVMLGLVNLGRGVPIMIFSIFGGVMADRFDRRKYLMSTQTATMLVSVLLAAVVWSGEVNIWIIAVLATCRGIVVAFNLPARHSVIFQLVPREDVASAVALNSVTINSAKVLGPLAAAGIIAVFDIATCFAVNAASFTVVLLMLLFIKLPPKEVRDRRRNRVWTDMREGFRYLRGDRTLMLLVFVGIVPTFFCQPYLNILAIFAKDVFAVGSTGLGIMVATAAFGSVCGGLVAAHVQRDGRRGTVMLGFMGMFGAMLVAFSFAPTIWLAVPLVFLVGMMHIAYASSNSTMLQLTVEDEYRGRVLSTLIMTRGVMSLGTATTATLAAMIGARYAMAGMASVVVVFAAVLWVRAPALRDLRV
ncbi:hypothetical protein ATO6_03350 [Oceanicola sp. 22II-s10i]|uniref:MFS transporter n=1 Tax=Oceanicola sp. 22II-s10i TaxID=1317116 RepID=UPI000B51E8C5|nr:MFS transporter [Oceanicola sp. 22II-s10i]OWU85932.1 hypothetical protein ATO6_03350 [Oceanicola sp. 22II-s10i]